eukprot:2562710-Pyramimonas_sp.AAC.1
MKVNGGVSYPLAAALRGVEISIAPETSSQSDLKTEEPGQLNTYTYETSPQSGPERARAIPWRHLLGPSQCTASGPCRIP